MGSVVSNGHRRRSSTIASKAKTNMAVAKQAEEMDEHDEDGSEDDEDEDEDMETPRSPPRSPVQLRGRGGFSHPPGQRPRRGGGGRGRGLGRGVASDVSKAPSTQAPKSTATAPSDPMDSLTARMSSLQFVPHAVRLARGRGRGGANAS